MTDRRSRLLIALVAFAAVFSFAKVSSAQSKAFVLRDKGVQAELGLTPAQSSKVDEIVKSMGSQAPSVKAIMQKILDAESADKEAEFRSEMVKEVARLKVQADVDVEKVLNDEQLPRFTQVMIQKIGPKAMLMDGYGDGLDLSDAQKEKLEKLISDRDRAVRSSMRQPKETREKIKADWDKKVVSGLNSKQQALWATKSGKSVAFAGVIAKVSNPEPGTEEAT